MKQYLTTILISFLFAFNVGATTIYEVPNDSLWNKIISKVELCTWHVTCYFGGYLGSTITTINGSDTLKDSRTTINNNFSALNNGKIENSTTTLPNITTLANLVTIGTITSGTWHGSVIGTQYGGTGASSYVANTILYGNGTGAILSTATGSVGQLLGLNASGTPAWQSPTVDQTANYNWTGSSTYATSTYNGLSTFNGAINFNLFPTTPNSYPTASTSVANKGYVDNIKHALGGFSIDMTQSSGATTTLTHNLGRTPNIVIVNCLGDQAALNTNQTGNESFGKYNGTTYSVMSSYAFGGVLYIAQTASSIVEMYSTAGATDHQSATATLGTNTVILTWTKTGSPTGNPVCTWEVN